MQVASVRFRRVWFPTRPSCAAISPASSLPTTALAGPATSSSVVAPVRDLGRRIAGAFSGNTALKQTDWEEF